MVPPDLGSGPRLRIGFEMELLAPAGSSRADLAAEVARRSGGGVHRFFHTDSEPSLVPGMDHFIHLTPGFDVVDEHGRPLCRLVDDITIRADLDPRVPPRPGWYRIVGDEPRLMRLVHRLVDPGAPLETVLDRVGETFGVAPQEVGGVVRVDDVSGATIAMAAPAPGERERACEVITPPIDTDHTDRLEQLLRPARDLGFTVPAEAAVHLHVDADPLREVPTFANLVRLFSAWREPLRSALATNPRCRRLAPLPPGVVDLVGDGSADRLPRSWDDLCALVSPLGLTKYADINLTRLIRPRPDRDTVEIRCLPGAIDTGDVIARVSLVEALLDRCRDPRPLPAPGLAAQLEDLLDA
jgi:Putative amidoligase enzyme